jgi:phasin family protein
MANDTFQQINEQFESTVFAPMRRYFAAITDHAEAVTSLQVEASKAYTEVAFSNVRAALDVRDAEGFKAYVSKQPDVAKQFGERVKNDAEKITAANQTFVENAQKVTQESVEQVQKAAEDGVQKVQKAANATK